MTWALNDDLRSARIALVRDALDAGGLAGVIRLYSGTRPAPGGAITTQVLQCSVPLAYPCGTVSGPTLTFDEPEDDGVRVAGDEITWARLVDSDDVFVADATVTAVDGGGDIIINSTVGLVGGPIRFVAGSLTD